ncbi:MAG TPA: hypothetical protein VN397_03060, partial [Candidatus Methylomirabilis sp.]|nr:hypothetical protein [Candidatus Methylomirabilis sp.]
MAEPPKQNSTPNFLTCPAFPELEAPDGSVVSGESAVEKFSADETVGSADAGDAGASSVPAASVPSQQSPLGRAIPSIPPGIAVKTPSPRRRRSPALWIALLAFLVLAATTGPALVALARAGVAAQSAKSALTRAVVAAEK